MTTLDEALELAARGWPVVLVKPRSKQPATAHGVKDATTDPDTIRTWLEQIPDANIGVACGAPGPHVLDIDDQAAAGDLAKRCADLGAPMVATGRGVQFYFDGTDSGTIGLGFGELRGRGSYVVAPPSIHPSGKNYTWVQSPNGHLPALPSDLIPRQAKTAGSGQAEAREHVPPGAMYDYLLDTAVRLARAGQRDVDVIAATLTATFEAKRAPGAAYNGSARDTRRIAEFAAGSDIARREAERHEWQTSDFASAEQVVDPPSSWAPVDLGPVLDGQEIDGPPSVLMRADGLCLLYPGRLHSLFGEPEAGKGWLALYAAAEQLDDGAHVLYVDFEDRPATIVNRLVGLGVRAAAIRERLHYVRPNDQLDPRGQAALTAVLEHRPTLAVLDGATEAYALHGLDIGDNNDAAKWQKLLPRRLADAGAAVLEIDHVTKDREHRGRYAIGAQHKLAGVDVAYAVKALEPLGRGRTGSSRITVMKDRPGHIRQYSDESAHVARFQLTEAAGVVSAKLALLDTQADAAAFRPTVLMERVSRALEEHPGLSVTAIRQTVKGKRNEYKDTALELLIADGHVNVKQEGRALRHYVVTPYRDNLPNVPEPAPGTLRAQPAPCPAPTGGTGRGTLPGTTEEPAAA